jgi:phosphinothricin acetyltransferase
VDVRAGRSEDLELLNDVYNHYVRTSSCTFDIDPVSIELRREWFAHYSTTGPYRVFVAVEDGIVAGFASSSRFMERRAYETSVSTSVYCSPDHTGKGVGSALYRALFDAISGVRGNHPAQRCVRRTAPELRIQAGGVVLRAGKEV